MGKVLSKVPKPGQVPLAVSTVKPPRRCLLHVDQLAVASPWRNGEQTEIIIFNFLTARAKVKLKVKKKSEREIETLR
jgi:hypothetical protein